MNSAFLERVKSFIPSERFSNHQTLLEDVVDNCTAASRTPALLIRVVNEAEIVQLVSLANQYQVPLYPISTGNNWGYGSRSPYKENCVILDLSLMNRITAFNEKTGVVTVQPGVTQEQLYLFLTEKKAPFLTPTTGAGPKASLLGNALEHGFGLTPEADHCLAIMNMEVILPDGSLYRSDFGENGAHDLDRNFKWSIGPYLDGIFTQSNFGIVTSMTIALSYRPSEIAGVYFTLKNDSYFEQAINAIQKIMKCYDGNVGGFNLMNSPRMLSMLQKSPSEKALTSDELKSLQAELALSDWTGVGTIYCEKEISKALKREIKKKLAPFCQQAVFLNRRQVQKIERLIKYLPRFLFGDILKQLSKVQESLDIFEGRPSAAALPLVYWRSRQDRVIEAEKINPDKGDVGLIWYAPIVVADAEKVKTTIDLISKTCLQFDIDPLITLTAFNGRVFDVTLPILFNRQDPVQVQKAHDCYAELFRVGQSVGSRPYRVGVQGSDLVIAENRFWQLQRKIKRALDPNGILSPGRYSAEEEDITQPLNLSWDEPTLKSS